MFKEGELCLFGSSSLNISKKEVGMIVFHDSGR